MLDNYRLTFFFFSIMMFSYENFIIYDFFCLSYNPDLGAEFIQNMWHTLDKWRIFLFYFHTIPLLDFCQTWKTFKQKDKI
jgi:hypothetical protein